MILGIAEAAAAGVAVIARVSKKKLKSFVGSMVEWLGMCVLTLAVLEVYSWDSRHTVDLSFSKILIEERDLWQGAQTFLLNMLKNVRSKNCPNE